MTGYERKHLLTKYILGTCTLTRGSHEPVSFTQVKKIY